MSNSADALILVRLVAAFPKLGDLTIYDERAHLPFELVAGNDDSPWARRLWKPAAITTPRPALEALYSSLPQRFPPLYEELLLSYRWLEVSLEGFVKLYANPPGTDFTALLSNMTCDSALTSALLPQGLLPFGKAAEDNYDQICFDTKRARVDGECPIVRVEHEAILCDGRLGRTWPVSESFRAFALEIIESAQQH